MTYSEKLKDPRWQRKRLEVMQRADFKCERCGNEESTLHINHLSYSGEPWEAPDDQLECLCEEHHAEFTENGGSHTLVIKFKGQRASSVREFELSLAGAHCKNVTLQELTAVVRAI